MKYIEKGNKIKRYKMKFTNQVFLNGKKYLSSFFFTLNILAFLLHTVLRLVDKKFNGLFEKSPRYEIFREMEVLTKFFYFEDIELMILLCFGNY